ncbi:MAG: glycosyl hydrolase family 28-related protein [Aulosira sp. ZfuVER01]|nr:glycosyl hydrolase family 28-related protein [Aulosira sp. ZfuVER01]MDZ7996302.1 glycosyl hydrolase family 28-related protein [Aulosira sp. DedVER01a]MDZ8055790.1 glycosyl hydrolase family 28-related protein [Aulosira sp. ZfuCHP01]
MIRPRALVFKLLPLLFFIAFLTTTCVDPNKNSENQIVALGAASAKPPEEIIYPQNSSVINVTSPEYGAIPNDGQDDTEAIQKALSKSPGGGRFIYLPNGVYNVSNSLHWPTGERYRSDYKRTILQGESKDGVIIQLQDKSPKFQNPKQPRPVISTGFDPDINPKSEDFKASLVAQRFGNSVRNLTINIGKSNPGAEGLNFAANNQGAVRSVKIISADRQGTTGLALTHGEVGPLLVEDVEIIGFDNGILTNNGINGVTLQNITVRDQKKAGIYNGGQVMSLEGFSSFNSVPAIINGTNPYEGLDPGSTLTLLNAKLIGRGKAKTLSAITSAGFIYARNVVSSGYKNVLFSKVRDATKIINNAVINEFTSHPIVSAFPSPKQTSKRLQKASLQLPIKQFPKLGWDNPKTWVSVEKFGAKPNDREDDTAAFQAAIDSGATTVFVPQTGNFTINGSLRLRSKVRRFTGTEGWIEGNGEIVAENGSQPTLIVENFYIQYGSKVKWRNVANRTVVYRSITHLDLESTGKGDLFIDDAVMGKLRFLNPDQYIWARQLNPEGSAETNIVNSGAKLWILGFKTEQGKTKIETIKGGSTELLGALIYAAGQQDPKDPLFRIVNSSCSFIGVAEAYFDQDTYQIWVEETRGNTTRKMTRDKIPGRSTANGVVMLLYTGFDKLPK